MKELFKKLILKKTINKIDRLCGNLSYYGESDIAYNIRIELNKLFSKYKI